MPVAFTTPPDTRLRKCGRSDTCTYVRTRASPAGAGASHTWSPAGAGASRCPCILQAILRVLDHALLPLNLFLEGTDLARAHGGNSFVIIEVDVGLAKIVRESFDAGLFGLSGLIQVGERSHAGAGAGCASSRAAATSNPRRCRGSPPNSIDTQLRIRKRHKKLRGADAYVRSFVLHLHMLPCDVGVRILCVRLCISTYAFS